MLPLPAVGVAVAPPVPVFALLPVAPDPVVPVAPVPVAVVPVPVESVPVVPVPVPEFRSPVGLAPEA